MRGVYDYRGECFGYIANGKLYDLEDNHYGDVSRTEVTSLNGKLIWHIDRDGLYDLHWQSIGYIGSRVQDGEHDGDW